VEKDTRCLIVQVNNRPQLQFGSAACTKIQLCGYLTARYAGMCNYGAVFGFMTSMIALASAVAPLLGGVAYDRWGNYDMMLIAGTILSLVSGALIFSLGAYLDWQVCETAETSKTRKHNEPFTGKGLEIFQEVYGEAAVNGLKAYMETDDFGVESAKWRRISLLGPSGRVTVSNAKCAVAPCLAF
jgi:hypothetical protein